VNALLSLTETTLSSLYYDSTTGNILLLNSEKDKIVCKISKKNSINMITEELHKHSHFHRPLKNSYDSVDSDDSDNSDNSDDSEVTDTEINIDEDGDNRIEVGYDGATDLFQQTSEVTVASSSLSHLSSIDTGSLTPLNAFFLFHQDIDSNKQQQQVNEQPVAIKKNDSKRLKSESLRLIAYSLSTRHWSLFTLYDSMIDSSSAITDSSSLSDTAWNHFLAMRYYERLRLETSISSDSTIVQSYNSSLTTERVKWIKKIFSFDYWKTYETTERKEARELLQEKQKKEVHESNVDEEVEIIPVFIVGFLRSGSTLLEHLLESSLFQEIPPFEANINPSSQPPEEEVTGTGTAVWSLGEASVLATYIVPLQKSLARLNASPLKGKRKILEEEKLLMFYQKQILFEMKEKYENFYKGLSSFNDSSLESNYSRPFPSSFSSDKHNERVEDYQQKKNGSAQSQRKKLFIIDKLLLNYYNIPYIQMLFPSSFSSVPTSAYILHISRDPLDCLFSCMKTRFASEKTLSYTLYDSTLLNEYSAYHQLMSHYERTLSKERGVLKKEKKVEEKPSIMKKVRITDKKFSSFLAITYEELISNTTVVLQEVLRFVGIHRLISEDNPTKSTSKYINTASFLQVKQPIYSSSINSWRKYSDQLSESFIPLLRSKFDERKTEK
jgi:hypothetical protein